MTPTKQVVKVTPWNLREHKRLFLDEKVKILDLLASGMPLAKVGHRVDKFKSNIWAINQKAAEIHSSVCAAPTMANEVSLVGDKVLTKTEKALNVWLEDISQKYISVDDKIMPEKAL